jgi:large subunit ribosomal protein L15
MPLARRLPKRGFTNEFRRVFQVVNVGSLGELEADIVDRETLIRLHLIRKKRLPLKVLGEGELNRPVHVKAQAFSRAAIAKIEKAGGKAEVVT